MDPSLIRSILVIKLRAIGDVLLSTVVLRNLSAAYPAAKIDFLTQEASREVLEGNPDVNELITFQQKNHNGLSMILAIRRRRYDLVIDLFGNPRSAIITLFSGASCRVGYRFGWRQFCYDVVVPPRGGEIHNTEFNLDALVHIGVPIIDRSPVFPPGAAATLFAEEFIRHHHLENTFVVALNPGGGWYTKRWPLEAYAKLGDRIASEQQAAILLLWGPGEEDAAKTIRDRMTSPAIMLPATTLKQLGAIMKKCNVVITNDSGPMHIAASVGTPIVAIFGPTNPELQGPVGSPSQIVRNERLVCLGCNFTSCPIKNPCMKELDADEVYLAFNLLLKNLHLQHQPDTHTSYEEKANSSKEKS